MYIVYFVLEMFSGRTAADAANIISAIVVYLFISDLFLVVIKIIQNFDLQPRHFLLFPTRPVAKVLSSYLILIYEPKSLLYLLPVTGFTIYFAVRGFILPIIISWLLVAFFLLAISLGLGILITVVGQLLREYKQAIIIGLWAVYLGYRVFPEMVTGIPPLRAFQQGLLALFSGDLHRALLQVVMTFVWLLVLFIVYAGVSLLGLRLPSGTH